MKRITDCSIDAYNRYRRLEQLQDPENRELYLEAVALCVQTVTFEQGRELTAAEIRDIEENIDIRSDDISSEELEFDLLSEHIKRGLPYTEAVIQAREEAASIRSELFDETLN
ncbi:MAG: hypothetical protein M1510_05270 [Nitrospirae bacterium]|nr:hypothetical protein [Nitrospirota bacterium]MCL5237238.1 hypothetical protein [Nitrospirota bacterium]